MTEELGVEWTGTHSPDVVAWTPQAQALAHIAELPQPAPDTKVIDPDKGIIIPPEIQKSIGEEATRRKREAAKRSLAPIIEVPDYLK